MVVPEHQGSRPIEPDPHFDLINEEVALRSILDSRRALENAPQVLGIHRLGAVVAYPFPEQAAYIAKLAAEIQGRADHSVSRAAVDGRTLRPKYREFGPEPSDD